jgi:sulfite reductase beta subunit-like hemoprotein
MGSNPIPTAFRDENASSNAFAATKQFSNMADWPHDPDGEEGSEGMRKYGQAVIAKKVDDEEDFPLDVSAFVDEHGDDPIRLSHERVVSLEEVFEGVESDEIEDIQSMHRHIGAAMRENGLWEYDTESEGPGTEA